MLQQTIRILETSRPIEIQPDQVATVIIQLVEEGKIQQEETNLYENSLYFSEWGIGNSIQRLLSRKKEIHYPEKEVQKNIRRIEKYSAYSMDLRKNKLSLKQSVPLYLF